ncbi:uncharacterized protein FFB20_05319 [Fusarium fujikuroi]|uniref:Uncharacterized protein n=1 Tax=Fusarium fujikuroi TaxID=5127 RepID=A0A9Q9RCF1_FUSFU|nr:uncharacterized protein FFB20_05319 [Fusarium fujikuroi]SCO34153.1 uncharacterized protein FFNC_03664 [Fusarium fujikuroi]SCO48642.1 uncharacterized protein FFMR_09282 [Fusarium fujikuroi]SCV35064.1 uncharacterized protein FFFS_04572 [Fusarium fujikuroi]VTT55718.1 unnamed protein product [Fusarium fujikuroi]
MKLETPSWSRQVLTDSSQVTKSSTYIASIESNIAPLQFLGLILGRFQKTDINFHVLNDLSIMFNQPHQNIRNATDFPVNGKSILVWDQVIDAILQMPLRGLSLNLTFASIIAIFSLAVKLYHRSPRAKLEDITIITPSTPLTVSFKSYERLLERATLRLCRPGQL